MFTCLGPRPGPESGGWGLLPMVAYAGKLRSKGKTFVSLAFTQVGVILLSHRK